MGVTMAKWQQRLLLGVILLVALALRVTGLDWDDYRHFHPDERYIAWVAASIEWPASWRAALDPLRSSLNPYYWPADAASAGVAMPQDQPRKFAYGHLPLYLGVAATRLAEWLGARLLPYLPSDWLLARDVLNGAARIEYRHLTAVSRLLTALFDVGTVLVLFWLGRLLFNPAVGLLAAAFLALNVMHIQLAHFFTSDPYLTFFVVTAVYFMVSGVGRVQAGKKGRRQLWLASLFVGLAVGSKFAAILLFLPLALAFALAERGRMRWLGLATAVFLACLAFVLTNPFAVLDWNCQLTTPARQLGPLAIPEVNWRSCYLENIVTQSRMARGSLDLPFTRQYQGTLPYLYHLEMQLRWGMGPLLGLVALWGSGWAIWRGRKSSQWATVNGQWLTVLVWLLSFLLTTGSFYVKFMRYLQPAVPFLMLFAAAAVCSLPWQRVRIGLAALVLAGTGVWTAVFLGIYTQPHPWLQGSRWIYANVPPGALILSEAWDDALPFSLDGEGQRAAYANEELIWLIGADERDNENKLATNLELLARGDYLVLTSNRLYGVIPRLPQRYPLSSQYHQLLFDGRLGYELVAVYGRFPHLGPVYVKPDTFTWPGLTPPTAVADYLATFPGPTWGRADESFIVYDQPLTMIWRNVERKTAVELAQHFAR